MYRCTGKFIVLAACIAASALFSAASAAQVYTNVTSSMGISISGLGSGAGWSDLDGDGDQDLLVSDSGNHTYLYRNDGSVFTNVTPGSGLSSEARNFALGDYDNDGLDDVAFISFGYVETILYHNIGGLLFDDISDTSGISGTYSWRCSWVDYNDDGLLDLYLCGETAYLFRNMGGGYFEEQAAAAGMSTGGRSCAWLDYDNDGFEDCYIGRYGDPNRLYRNNGNGTFQEVGAEAGVNDAYNTSGVCAGDFDGDGWFDLYSVNISSPGNNLYRNLGNGTFQNVTAEAGVADVGDGRTATFLDIDYDGMVDLFTSNHVNSNRLYRNNGNGTFTDIAPALAIADPPDPFGTGFADYDDDGDIDVFLATHFGSELLRCDGVTNHWIKVLLIGTSSNRNAIGAVACCTAGGNSSFLRVDGGHGMGDMDSKELEFGLGTWTGNVEVSVKWPSGLQESFSDLSPDTSVELVEGTGTGVGENWTRPLPQGTALTVSPNPASDHCSVVFTSMNAGPSADISLFDLTGRMVWRTTSVMQNGQATESLPVNGLASGVYSLRVSSGEACMERRMALLH